MTLLVVALALGLGSSWVTAATVFPIWSHLARVRPSLARRSALVAAVPLLAGATLVFASLLPGDPHLDTLIGCHCATSAPGWLHLCPLHPERAVGLLLPALVVLALLLPGRIRALATLATEPRGQGGTRFLDLPRPAILLHGWLRPTLAVDRRLWAALSPTDRAAVLAHEHAHLARRDPLVLMALRLLVGVGPAEAGRALVRGWLDHAERMADARAADTIGDPIPVAEALLRCARLSEPRRLAIGWTGGRLEARVHALLDGAAPSGPDLGRLDLLALVVAAVAALASAPWLHHHLEHLLNLSF